jgi:hypothetical protein
MGERVGKVWRVVRMSFGARWEGMVEGYMRPCAPMVGLLEWTCRRECCVVVRYVGVGRGEGILQF